jgi:hypothetical protein
MVHLGFLILIGLAHRSTRQMAHHAPQPQLDQHDSSKNVTTRAQTGCVRVKIPPHWRSILAPSIFAEWGLTSKRILVAGCSE